MLKMKKLILILFLLISFNYIDAKPKKWYQNNSKIETVNERTVIFKNVVRIDIKTHNKNQITYVYDLNHSKLIKVARGSFEVELPMGNYLIQSNEKITKTLYEVIVE